MRRLKGGLLPAILLALSPLGAISAATAAPAVPDILAEFDRMAERPLWPGFTPKTIPVAIYDGANTWLARHPAPPAGFVLKAEALWVFPGQHPAMRANTSVDLGGTSTATLLLDLGSSRAAREWAAALIHETFHVFERQRHPAWIGNEGELFVYPMDDPELLARRRLETEALRRALAAAERPATACWAARAVEQRRQRFAAMAVGSVAYERGTELNEGLAAFVEDLALDRRIGSDLPAGGYGPNEVRTAAYGIGPALAALLDRFDATWKTRLENGPATSLDEMLAMALPLAESAGCSFTAAEKDQARVRAAADTALVVAGRKEHRDAFFARAGLRLVIEAGSQPLWPQAFDPWNVEALGGGEVLHRRWLKLGNDRGTLEVLDREALTAGAGEHPLFQGVRTLTVSGLAAEPAVTQEGETLKIAAAGLKASLKGAVVERQEGLIRVTWPAAPAVVKPESPPSAGATPPRAPGRRSSTG